MINGDIMNFVPKEKSREAIQRLLDERDRINAEKREEYRKKHFKNNKEEQLITILKFHPKPL